MNTTYSIIAGAALQFLDYELDLAQEVEADNKNKKQPLAKKRNRFHVGKEAGRDVLMILDKPEDQDDDDSYIRRWAGQRLPLHYEIETKAAFDCFLGRWLPMPFLVRSGVWSDQKPRYGYGPTDWVRGFLSRQGDENSLKYHLTLVFDPQVEDGAEVNIASSDGAVIYHALSEEDVKNNVSFALTTDLRDYFWFINDLPWVKEALRESLDDFRKAQPKARLIQAAEAFEDQDRVPLDSLAVYCAYLEGLGLTDRLGEVRLVNPEKHKPIDVDLVLDIGNSRFTGVLVETLPQGKTKLTDCYVLPVRDLSEPANIYAEPLATQVEFAEPYFGHPEWSLSSRQHSNSFPWPSTVRLGPEASRLSNDSREDLGPTGMSSPKRYLWDTRQRDMFWYLNNKYKRHGDTEEMAAGRGTFLLRVNVAGVPLSVFEESPADTKKIKIPKLISDGYGRDDDLVAFESRYSRSSLMMFLLSEIITQALTAINNPQTREAREHSNAPRRLSRIIMTVPTAMPLVEQNIFKTWARLAVETVWAALGWTDHYRVEVKEEEPGRNVDFRLSPGVRCEWDEATCTQVVWLYNEIRVRFHNNAEELFKLLGREREFHIDGQAPRLSTLRMASIDMGGGTTDLAITTYAIRNPGVASPQIVPRQDFRDGFNVAGDDIMLKIIQTQFIDKIILAAKERSVPDADGLVRDLFQEKVRMGAPKNDGRRSECLRSQFVVQVATALALKILKLYENVDLRGHDLKESLRVGDILLPKGETPEPGFTEVLDYLQKPLREAGWKDFDLLAQLLDVDFREVDENVNFVLEKVMKDLAEVVWAHDCDVLILTGRPSRWPAMMRSPYRNLCLPVDRIVHMHKYRVGHGYPFENHGRIEDPKTTVVIGAIICALAEGSLEGIHINCSCFEPQPTIRFLGMLDDQGRMAKEWVWFGDIDIYSTDDVRLEREIEFSGTIPVGFRQMGCPRWTTTKLYSLEYRNNDYQKQGIGRTPYKVKLEYALEKAEDEAEAGPRPAARQLRRTEGKLTINSIADKFGQTVNKSALNVRLQTLRNDDGYWLDTGVLYF